MALNDIALQEAICSTLQTLVFGAITGDRSTDIPVISAEQDSPRPVSDTYIDVRLADFGQIGQGIVGKADADSGYLTPVRNDYRVEFRIRAVGKAAKNAASEVLFSFNRPDVLDSLIDAGLNYSISTDPVHIPTLTDTDWEPRTQFQAAFYISERQLIDLGYILAVEDVSGIVSGSILGTQDASTGLIEVTT